jgi:hypothetical protein
VRQIKRDRTVTDELSPPVDLDRLQHKLDHRTAATGRRGGRERLDISAHDPAIGANGDHDRPRLRLLLHRRYFEVLLVGRQLSAQR